MRDEAIKIVKVLQDSGYVAYFAGGCVRDLLMHQEPNDIDIATSAKPDEVEKLFTETYPIGKEYGTILVRSGKHQFEVTTFREEGSYKDGRRPSTVKFTNAKQDALRRDFTINGIFYNPANGSYIDYVGGRDDIKKRVIDFIGSARERILEDKLRLVRAVRFKVTLGFQYSDETLVAVKKNANLIREVSSERVRDEINKIFANKNRHIGLVELSRSGILRHILPEVEKLKGVPQPIEYHHEGDCFTHTYLALRSLPPNAPLRLAWAVLLHDIAKPKTIKKERGKISFPGHAQESARIAEEIMKRFKFSKTETKEISWLIYYHMSVAQIDQMRPGKRLEFLTDPKFNDLIELVEADSKGTYPVNLDLVEKMEAAKNSALLQKNSIKTEKRLINGDDLISLGIEPGKKFKKILEDVLDRQIGGDFADKQVALDYVKKTYL